MSKVIYCPKCKMVLSKKEIEEAQCSSCGAKFTVKRKEAESEMFSKFEQRQLDILKSLDNTTQHIEKMMKFFYVVTIVELVLAGVGILMFFLGMF